MTAVTSADAAVGPDDRSLVVTRAFDAPRERVFDAWTDPTQVDRWWGPEGVATTADEICPRGIRVVTLKTGGVPESIPDDFEGRDEIAAALREETLLNRTATLSDVGDVATFVASDRARTVTGTEVTVSCGAMLD